MSDRDPTPTALTFTGRCKAKARRRANLIATTRAASKEHREIEAIKRRISEPTIRWVMESGYTRAEAERMARRAKRWPAT